MLCLIKENLFCIISSVVITKCANKLVKNRVALYKFCFSSPLSLSYSLHESESLHWSQHLISRRYVVEKKQIIRYNNEEIRKKLRPTIFADDVFQLAKLDTVGSHISRRHTAEEARDDDCNYCKSSCPLNLPVTCTKFPHINNSTA